MKKIIGILISCFILLIGCQHHEDSEDNINLHVAVASSLLDVMEEIEEAFTQEYPHIKLTFIYGSSVKLAKQIEQGAPVDVFLSANMAEMDKLVEGELVISATVQPFATNELVIVSHQAIQADNLPVETILNHLDGWIAIGEPENVPLGIYTKYALDQNGLWNDLVDRFVFGADARQVKTYVRGKSADYGIVYQTDVYADEELSIVYSFDPFPDNSIIYPVGVVKDTEHLVEAEMLIDFIVGKEGQTILRSFGFLDSE